MELVVIHGYGQRCDCENGICFLFVVEQKVVLQGSVVNIGVEYIYVHTEFQQSFSQPDLRCNGILQSMTI